jgi:hypothetical protein
LVDTCICIFTVLMPLANFEGANLNCSFSRMCIRWSANLLSDQLVLRVLLIPLYAQLCFQPMYASIVTPEYFGCNESADEPVVL